MLWREHHLRPRFAERFGAFILPNLHRIDGGAHFGAASEWNE